MEPAMKISVGGSVVVEILMDKQKITIQYYLIVPMYSDCFITDKWISREPCAILVTSLYISFGNNPPSTSQTSKNLQIKMF